MDNVEGQILQDQQEAQYDTPKPGFNAMQIAQICHDANRTYCRVIGDYTQELWDNAQQWQRDSAIKGVEYALENPDADASSQHEAWVQDKLKDGWNYGLVKDAEKKEHPCIVPYHSLPVEQRIKDHLFKAVVKACSQK